MYIDTHGLLQPAAYKPSPHCDARPLGVAIDLIVIHGISLPPGKFGQNMVEPFFCGKLETHLDPYFETIAHLKVSAHLFIDRHGEVTQFVPFLQRAWHAGQSIFQGRPHCNDFSIGIELEGTDVTPYEKAQYAALARLLPLLMQNYPAIKATRLVGHSDIAPGRKTDPGEAFDWEYLRALLEKEPEII
jgi:N-acetyl-anhydromuramoyl-L-alanine amidase